MDKESPILQRDNNLEGYDEYLQESIMGLIEMGCEDSWLGEIYEIEEQIEESIINLKKRQVTKAIKRVVSLDILVEKRAQKSMSCLPQRDSWFKIQRHVTDSEASKVLNRAQAGN